MSWPPGGCGCCAGRPAVTGGAITAAIWFRSGKLPTASTLASAVLSICLVGLGTSLGREGALKETGAAVAARLAAWAGLTPAERRLLVACGAGAGMAAAYNVPLGGALFALEVLLGSLNLALVIPALTASFIATAVAWLLLPDRPTYSVPDYVLTGTQLVWALPAGPLLGLASAAYVRLIAWADGRKPHGRYRLAAPVVVLTGLGLVAVAVPHVLGNGKGVVQLAFTGELSLALLLTLAALKPLATASCLGSGAPGGLFTPTLTYGSLVGALLGYGWDRLWPGAPAGSYALLGAGAVLAATTQGPVSAVVLLVELTGHVDALMVPLLTALAGAVLVAHRLEARSIYTAGVRRGEAVAQETGRSAGAPGGLETFRVVSAAARLAEVAECVAALAPRGGSLYVVDERGRFVGEITADRLAAAREITLPLEAAAADDLARPVPALPATLDPAEMARRLEQSKRPRLPVVDGESGRLVGVFPRQCDEARR